MLGLADGSPVSLNTTPCYWAAQRPLLRGIEPLTTTLSHEQTSLPRGRCCCPRGKKPTCWRVSGFLCALHCDALCDPGAVAAPRERAGCKAPHVPKQVAALCALPIALQLPWFLEPATHVSAQRESPSTDSCFYIGQMDTRLQLIPTILLQHRHICNMLVVF